MQDVIPRFRESAMPFFFNSAALFLSTSEPTRILKQPEYKVVQRGMSAAFECKVKHDPTLIPIMTWLKDSGELPDDERYRATQGGREEDRTEISSNTVMRLGLWLMQTL